jgi:hypothetical protein
VSLLPVPTHDYGTNRRPERQPRQALPIPARRACDRCNGRPQVIPHHTDHERSSHETENSTLPQGQQAGLLRRSTVWRRDGFEAITDFARAILATARSWVDESLIVMPDYRDRVVTVWHDDTEGGLNLTMSKAPMRVNSHPGLLAPCLARTAVTLPRAASSFTAQHQPVSPSCRRVASRGPRPSPLLQRRSP